MESIAEDPFFKFRPDTLYEVRKEFNLNQPGAMDEAIKSFDEWIQKQNHFTKRDFNRHFLEVSIILSKGSLERAKKTLDKLCTMKTLLPKFFSKHDIKEIMDVKDFVVATLMPRLTKDHYRVFVFKAMTTEFDSTTWFEYYRYIMLICEYVKAHDYFQGFCFLVDVRDINIVNFAMKLNVLDMRNLVTLLTEGYGVRMKGIHIVTESKAVDVLVGVIKQIVSEKIGKRVQVHRNLDSVYDCIEKELLPIEYGGQEKPLIEIYEDMRNLLGQKENVEYFSDISQAGTNEAYRHTAVFNNDILGMPGSFRSLTVD